MLNLAFDTTAGSCSVILTEDGKTVGKIIEKMDFGQAEALFPAIEKIMSENRLKPADLYLITVCIGHRRAFFAGGRAHARAGAAFNRTDRGFRL